MFGNSTTEASTHPSSPPEHRGILVLLDGHNTVIGWNPAAEELFGLSEGDVLGRQLDELPIPDVKSLLDEIQEVRATGTPHSLSDISCGQVAATPWRIEWEISPLRTAAGGNEQVAIVGHDISEHVRGRAQAEARADQISRQAERRERFFSAMSHDLRTPITALVGYSELLLDGIVGELNETQHEMIGRISQVADHLSSLLDDVLDLARLDAGRLELHPEALSLEELVEDAVVAIQPQRKEKDLGLGVDLDDVGTAVVYADRMRVRQILVNLLSNAVKFTNQGELSVEAGLNGEQTWIAVRDTGPGLPEGGEEALFEEFTRLASGQGAKKTPGSGLGLAISRRLARAMGGDLIAENRSGAGATFTLFLPLGADQTPASSSS